ncbi:hypothetical protein [Falsiroseomonas sp. CW058]|uniref:hypothetical protein n=1 Tax=Falsiroseomonas sp. CW058 TaxID=3388664 RepID=UPI003D313E71
MDEVGKIRAQRAEVEAALVFRHAPEGEGRILAWWRLHGARRARLAALPPVEAARLPALPPPPPGALGRWQGLRLRLGLLRLERAAPPAPVARALGGA